MPSWIDKIREELEHENTVRLLEPNSEVQPSDHIAGDLDDSLRVLYSLAIRWEKSAIETIVASRYDNAQEQREHHLELATQARERSEALLKVFWISVKDTHDLWQKPSVGIRQGWKVVWSDSSTPPITQFLRSLFGQ